jgi:hypothetical protein
MNDDAIGRNAHALACQIMVLRIQNPAAHFMPLLQATEAKNRGLLRCRGLALKNS